MFGFDSYLPAKWLDGALSVHVKVAEMRAEKHVARRVGKWLAGGVVVAASVSGVVSMAKMELVPAFSTRALTFASGFADRSSEFASAGFMKRLQSAIELLPDLPTQSLEFDPPALV